MALSEDTVRRLRRMVDETEVDSTYTSDDLEILLQTYPIIDSEGILPTETGWTPTYDINMAASIIWLEKASKYAREFDFSADGGNFSRSQKQEAAVKMSTMYASRSKAVSSEMTSSRRVFSAGNDSYYKDWIDDYESRLV